MTDRRLKITAIVLATLGIADAGYLVYVHYAGIEPACSIAHGCVKVQSSVWAEFHGIPIALIGLFGYVSILASLFLPGDLGRGASFGLSLFGFVYSAYLTYRELFSIEAICQWCVVSAVLMTLLAIVTTIRLVNSPSMGVTPPPEDADEPPAGTEPQPGPESRGTSAEPSAAS